MSENDEYPHTMNHRRAQKRASYHRNKSYRAAAQGAIARDIGQGARPTVEHLRLEHDIMLLQRQVQLQEQRLAEMEQREGLQQRQIQLQEQLLGLQQRQVQLQEQRLADLETERATAP